MRETLLLYMSMKEPVEAMTDEQAGQLFKAIIAYQAGEQVNLDGLLNVVFLQIKQQIDDNNKKYDDICKKRSEAGKKGMEARWRSNNKAITNDNTITSVITKDNKNNYNVNDNDNDNDIKHKVPTSELAGEFEDVWKLYPRKQGKEKAKTAYIRARQKGTKEDDVINGIKAYIDHIQRNKIEPQYIKMGSTFFANKSWQDDYSANYTRGRPDTRGAEREYDMKELELKLLATN